MFFGCWDFRSSLFQYFVSGLFNLEMTVGTLVTQCFLFCFPSLPPQCCFRHKNRVACGGEEALPAVSVHHPRQKDLQGGAAAQTHETWECEFHLHPGRANSALEQLGMFVLWEYLGVHPILAYTSWTGVCTAPRLGQSKGLERKWCGLLELWCYSGIFVCVLERKHFCGKLF